MHVCKYMSADPCLSLESQIRIWASISILVNYFNGEYSTSWGIAFIRCFIIFNFLLQSHFLLTLPRFQLKEVF